MPLTIRTSARAGGEGKRAFSASADHLPRPRCRSLHSAAPAGVEAPERETFEAALKSGRMTLEALGLGAYEARERADLFRRFNLQMVEEMVAMAENDAASRVAVFKRTSDMLTGIINEDRHHLSLVQRHGWQGTEEGRHTGDIADEPENKPSA